MSYTPPTPLAEAIERMLADGARMREVEVILQTHLFDTRHLWLPKLADGWNVVHDNDGIHTYLFKSESYVAALEFALKQPMIEQPKAEG